MKKIIIIVFVLASFIPVPKLFSSVSLVHNVYAACNPTCSDGEQCIKDKCVKKTGTNDNVNAEKLNNPLGNNIDTPEKLIGKVINSLMGLVGSLALLMFVYGGLVWMTSSGSQDKVKKGRDIVMWAAIGLIIVFSSYGLIRFLLSNIAS